MLLFGAAGSADFDNETRVELARRSRAARRHRENFVGLAVARDLPWEILMVLYATGTGRPLKVTSIQVDVNAPLTTVLRWLQTLEQKGFIERRRHPHDRRVAFVALSEEGKLKLDSYFDAVVSIGSATI